MQKLGPYYIGQVTLLAIRGWILDSGLTDKDTVLLHPTTFENVVEDYRQMYREPMPNPFFLLGVLIDETTEVRVPENRVVALVGDERADRPMRPTGKPPQPVDDGRDVYRCGWCGSIINDYGEVLEGEAREYSIFLLRTRGDSGTRHRDGECCKGRTH